MSNNTYKTRVQLKNDTAENWEKAVNFIPLQGEMILYNDTDGIKIGDGVTNVNNLSFVHSPLIIETTKVAGEENKYTANKTVDEILEAILTGHQIFLSLDGISVLTLQSLVTTGDNTALVYSGSLQAIVYAIQIGNEIVVANQKILTNDDVNDLINNARLLKKKIITDYTYTNSGLWTVTNSSGEAEDASEDYIYLKKISENTDSETVYAQYSLINNQMVELGTTKMTLSDYVTNDALQTALANIPSSGGTSDYNQLINKPQTVALSTSISSASTDNNAVSPKAVYDYVQMAIASLPTVYTGDTTPDSTFGNNGDVFLIVEE